MSKECPTCGISTPNMMFVLRQRFPNLVWQIVPVPEDQGKAMRERGEPHVYDTAQEAKAAKLNKETKLNKEANSCPFCSSETELVRIEPVPEFIDKSIPCGFWIRCKICRCCGPIAETVEEAIKLWNDRSMNRVET